MVRVPSGIGWISWRAVSSRPQAETESLSEQHRLNLRLMEQFGGYLYAELEVPGISRSLDSFEEARRTIPAYEQLWRIIESKPQGQLLILVARDRSRLGRTVALIESVARACNVAGIAIYPRATPPLSIDPKEQQSQSNLLYSMIGSYESQAEVERLVDRRARGMVERTKKGKHPGKLPFWLKRVYLQNGEVAYEADEEMVAMALQFVDEYLDGVPLREITRDLNEAGYRHSSGRQWSFGDLKQWPSLAWRMAGYVEFNIDSDNEYVKVKSALLPALVSDDIAQAILDEAKHRHAHRKGRSVRRFTFACVCGYCGGYLISGGPKRYICKNRCSGSHIMETKLTEAVKETLGYLSTKINRETLVALLVEPGGNLEDEITTIDKQIEGVRRQQERLLFAYTSGAVEFEQYQAANDDFKRRIASMTEKLAQLQEDNKRHRSEPELLEMLENIATIGDEIMDESTDSLVVNRWLREHFQFVVANYRVVEVKYR